MTFKNDACLTSLLLAIAIVTTAPACGYNRIVLPVVPSKTAVADERLKALKDLQIENQSGTTYKHGTSWDFVILANGVRVEDPRDLLPAMEPGSPAATYVKSFEEKYERSRTFEYITLGGLLGGLAVMVSPFPAAVGSANPGDLQRIVVPVGIGAGIVMASLIPLFISTYNGFNAEKDRRSAFMTYPKSLQSRLALDGELPSSNPQAPAGRSQLMLRPDAPYRVALLPAKSSGGHR